MRQEDRFFRIGESEALYDIGLYDSISPDHLLVLGTIGSGKTVVINNIATSLKHYHNTKIIFLTEKADSACENCFCGIETYNKKQIQMLEKDLMWGKAIKQEKIEIYHPFTFDFPKTIMPNVFKLFTLPIKGTSELGFSALLNRELDSPSVNLCKEVMEDLTNEDDIFGFLLKAFTKSSVKDDESGARIEKSYRFPYIPIGSFGSKKDIEQIKMSCKAFERCFVLHSENCELNLTDEKLIEILNDVETTTFFSFWKIKDEKLKYFLLIELLNRLHRVIPDNAKHSLMICFEEVKILFPKSLILRFQKILCEELVKMLMGIRTAGRGVTCVFTSQSYYETNPLIRDVVNDGNIMLMRLSHEDQSSFHRDAGLMSSNYNILTKLRKGEFVFLRDIKDKYNEATVFRAFYVPYAHREPGMPPFVEYWNKCYPDRTIKFHETINKMKKLYDNEKDDAIKRQEEFLGERKKRKEDKIKAKILKEEPIKEKTDFVEVSQEIKQKCYETTLNTPEASWNGRVKAELVEGVDNPVHFQRFAVDYALSIGDLNFIQKFSQKKFFQRFFPEHYNEVYEDAQENKNL